MCMIDKEWPKVKEESELLVKQMKSLMTAFLNVENDKTRENLVEFFQTLCELANSQNGQKIIQTISKDKRKINNALQGIKEKDVNYVIAFIKYINNIHSIALKDQALEMVKMMGL